MSITDASFLHMENEVTTYNNAWLGIFEGPAPSGAEFRRHIAAKLPQIPRYRQRVCFVPQDIAPPVWVDDRHFHLPYHVRYQALTAPGEEDQLKELFTTLTAKPFDRNKPLWEMRLIDGLEEGRWALISQLHHCMFDGVSTTDIITTVLDRDPLAATPEVIENWRPQLAPTDAELIQAAMSASHQAGLGQTSRYAALVSSLHEQNAEVGKAFASLKDRLDKPLSIPSLNGPIGPYRRWAWAKVSLADISSIRRVLGGTVNDVVLAVVTRAFRDLLLSRGEQVTDRTVRCQVPVSMRGSGGEEGGNQIACMYAELPVGIADAQQRLASIRVQMGELKSSKQALAVAMLTSLSGFQSPALMALNARQVNAAPNPVNTIVTNVPGPQHPLYVLGRKMLDCYPYIPLASTTRLATSVLSYDGYLRFGVLADYDSTPDLGVFAGALENELRDLMAVANSVPSCTA